MERDGGWKKKKERDRTTESCVNDNAKPDQA